MNFVKGYFLGKKGGDGKKVMEKKTSGLTAKIFLKKGGRK